MQSIALFTRCVMVGLGCALLSGTAAADYPVDFDPLADYPPVSNNAVAAVLGDGRFIVYDGDKVFVEDGADAGTFIELASGYLGDPAFIAVAPDGHRCLLGAGEVDWESDPSNDWVWLFDVRAPEDAPPVDGFGDVSDGLALVTSNYWGTWLDDDLVLIEAAPGWISELGILDVTDGTYRKVVNKGASSASLVRGSWVMQDQVFATIGFGAGSGTTRRFAVRDLIDVFRDPAYDVATSPLDWDDGAYVGVYADFSAGPSASTDAGTLVFGGHNSEILYVNPLTGHALGPPVAISGSPGRSVRPYFNPITKRILVTETDWGGPPLWTPAFAGHISAGQVRDLPATSTVSLAGLVCVLGWTAHRALRRRACHKT